MLKLNNLKQKYLDSSILHLFVITNPIQSILINEYISKMNILLNNIILVDLRHTKVLSYASLCFYPKETLINRTLKKIFNFDYNLNKLKKIILNRNQNFLLYVPWDLSYFYTFRKEKLCIGHVYVEEGDLSYYKKDIMYNWRKLVSRDIRKKLKNTVTTQFLNHDFEFVIVTNYSCFPTISKEKKFLIKSFVNLEKIYLNKLKKNTQIGVLPSALRLNEENLEEILLNFSNYMSKNSYLKVHPSLLNYPKLKKKLIQLNVKMNNYFNIIENDFILEAEMMQNKLYFYGLKSSVQRYAKKFGSNYLEIKELLHLQLER